MRGQSSGDFKETSGRVHLFHVGTRNSVGALATDAFTQANPVVYTGATLVSTTLAGITKVGVLGASVAFTRPQVGNNVIGGPSVTAGPVFLTGQRPLGIFLNDAVGNAFENTPGPASGRGAYVCGYATIGVTLYETKVLQGTGPGAPGDNLVYAVGDRLYASANGLLTNNPDDAYEQLFLGVAYNTSFAASNAATVMGVVKAIPDASTPMLVLDLRV
jgi:hypothetical protein